ncbi:MAG: hypothetical protein KAS23_13585 [Anaerohalosphaera sp.]|nr:hypothetical protein [Anaerohalosphaera sp.]
MSRKGRKNRHLKPYLAIAAVIVVVILVLYGVSKLGGDGQVQIAGPTETNIPDERPVTLADDRQGPDGNGEVEDSGNTSEALAPPSPERTQEIIVASYAFSNELVPVKKFFAQNGIETEIVKSGSGYVLVTADKYITPAKPQGKAEIEAAKNKIKDIGAGYKPPSGYGSFTFGDIYARKFQ